MIGACGFRSPTFRVSGRLSRETPVSRPVFAIFPYRSVNRSYFWFASATSGTEKEHPAPAFKIVFHPRHLADEGLAARRRSDNQQVFPVQQSRFHRELLGRHERHTPLPP